MLFNSLRFGGIEMHVVALARNADNGLGVIRCSVRSQWFYSM